MIQNKNQIKVTPAWNFVAMLEKVFFFVLLKPFIDRACLGLQSFPDRSRKNFPRASQHHIDLDHRRPLFEKKISYSSYNLQNMMKWKNHNVRSYLLFFNFSFLVSWIPEVFITYSALRKRSLRINSTVYDIPSGMQLSKKNPVIFLCTETFTLTYDFHDFRWMGRRGYISLGWPICRN